MEALVEGGAPVPTHYHHFHHHHRVRPPAAHPDHDDAGKPPARTPSSSSFLQLLTQLGWAALVVGVVTAYLALALNGGAVELIRTLERWGGPRDIYEHAPAHGRAYALHPFHEMFWPLHVARLSPRRSLAVFTAGRDGLANVDRLVRAWGHERFDFLICHYDESQAEWAALPWYKQAVGFYAHRQGKMFFFKVLEKNKHEHTSGTNEGTSVSLGISVVDLLYRIATSHHKHKHSAR